MVDESYNNEFELQLKEAGYKWFKDNWKNSLRGFQKRIKDDMGTKYFITGYHWNFGKSYPDKAKDEDQYSFDVQFRLDKNNKDIIIDVRLSANFLPNPHRKVTTLKEVEKFYEREWNNMKADYYELNNYKE